MRRIYTLALSLLVLSVSAQKNTENEKSKNFPKFPKIENACISGAPLLSQPVRIDGKKQEIRTEKHGLAYPAFFDWNKDGKKDLLVGEFETGAKGSNLKIFLNEGSNRKPKYSGKYTYATDVNGDTITANFW